MATLKQRMHKKNSSGSYDTVHLETSSSLVLRPSGRTVEQDLADYLPKTQASDTPPSTLKTGSMVTGLSKAWLGVNNTATELSFGGTSLKTETITKTFNGEAYYQYYDSRYAFPYIFTGDLQKTIIFFTIELANIRFKYTGSNNAALVVKVIGSKYDETLKIYEQQTSQSAQSYYAQGAIAYGQYITYGSSVYPGLCDDNSKITYYIGALQLTTNNYVLTINSGTLTYTYYYI